ncbi:MAG: hypothetical protein R3F59_19825 [Myxococcota bacterium]
MILVGLLSAAWAAPEASLHGDLKTFTVGSAPKAWIVAPVIPPAIEPLLPDDFDPDALVAAAGLSSDPTVQGIVDFRLKGRIAAGKWRAELHHALSLLPKAGGGLGAAFGGGASTGVGLTAPQLLPLTWEPDLGAQTTLRGRVDRLWVAYAPEGAEVTLGRQPITFGTGLVFTPMDVVNPFFVATIDTEYKPGVDALRVDVFAGTAGRATTVAAWSGALPITDPDAPQVDLGDVILAENAQVTVGVTDLVGLVGLVRSDGVFGLGTISAIGPLGVHGEVTLTLPGTESTEGQPFVRAVLGGEGRPTANTTVAVEGYYQSFGASDPQDYLAQATNPRFLRGEVWLLGQGYAAVSVSQQITPLVTGSAAVIGNLLDPSALVAPSLTWSVADEATAAIGGYLSLGRGPDEVPLELDPTTFAVSAPPRAALARSVNSEFGLYPHALFVSLRTYF